MRMTKRPHRATAFFARVVTIGLAFAATTVAQDYGECPLELDGRGVPIGWVLLQGDILVPPLPDGGRATYELDTWTNGEVPYQFDSNVNSAQRTQAHAAMATWEAVANVDFRPREWWEVTFLHIRDSSNDPEPSNSSPVGMGVGPRIVNLTSWGNLFIIAHEFGHSLGYWHEQSRTDRDNFVRIEFDNVEEGKEHNFEIQGWSRNYPPGVYDFDSLMHYKACEFSVCDACVWDDPNCRTITVLPQWYDYWQWRIGQREHLSAYDALVMSFLYPQDNWVFVDAAYSGLFQNGSFPEPYREFADGASNVPASGVVWLQPGVYDAKGAWPMRMTLKAPIGGVVLK